MKCVNCGIEIGNNTRVFGFCSVECRTQAKDRLNNDPLPEGYEFRTDNKIHE